MGDHIYYYGDRIGRVDGLVIYKLGVPRLFLKLAVIELINDMNVVLDVERFRLTGQYVIISLPDIGSSGLYMIIDNKRNYLLRIP